MRHVAELVRQLLYRLRGERNDAEADEEMRLHLELRAEQARAQGLDPATARRRFGNPTLLREQGRDAWGWTYVDGWLRDIREASRTLLASPGFTATAVVSLALGIGANTAIFSLINALLLRTLPVEDPRELVTITLDGGNQTHLTNPLWEQIRDNQESFSGVFAFGNKVFDLAPSGETEPAEGLWVSGDFFRVLGVSPMRGRLINVDDDRRGGAGPDGPVAVISYRVWEVRYGKDEEVIGRTILLDRQPFRIVGVTPEWFKGLDADLSFGVAVPIGAEPLLRKDGSFLDHRSAWWLRIMGRLPPEASIEAANAHLDAISPGILRATVPAWKDEYQQNYLKKRFTALPAATGFSETGKRYDTALHALLGIAGLVLLIACANLANLLLARSAQRGREVSMRMALGAGRARLVRRLLCESFLLAALGAGAGFGLAVLGSRLLVQLIETEGGRLSVDLAPDARVLGFTMVAAVLTAFLFGLTPALRATRIRLNEVLKEGARGSSQSANRMWLGKAIIAGQLALSLVLLTGAVLFAGTMRECLQADLGFDPRSVLAVRVDVEKAEVPKGQRPQLASRILDRLRAAPGVESAAQAQVTPISGVGWNDFVAPDGYQPKSREDALMFFNAVSPGYFSTMGTQLLMGRDFGPSDTLESPKVLVIDEASARRYWGAENPIGKILRIEGPGRAEPEGFQVVGVVRPIKYKAITEVPSANGYFPASQREGFGGSVYFVARSNGAASAITEAVREAIASVNPRVSITFRELETQVRESIAQQQLVATLSLAFAGLALLLSVIGLYGVTSYTAARRRGEIGIRMALGAKPRAVVGLMVRDLAVVFACGLALGWAVSLGLGSMIESLLFGVEPGDPRLLGLAALILAGVSALAAYVPARRASKLQPIVVLREE
jgi:predicted permease